MGSSFAGCEGWGVVWGCWTRFQKGRVGNIRVGVGSLCQLKQSNNYLITKSNKSNNQGTKVCRWRKFLTTIY